MPRDVDFPRLPTASRRSGWVCRGVDFWDQQQRHEALVQTAGRSFDNKAGTFGDGISGQAHDCTGVSEFHATVGSRDVFSSAVVVVVVVVVVVAATR
ncbi:unnamed protein product [Boreogadus saida]